MVVGPKGAKYAHGTMVVTRDVPGHPPGADVVEALGSARLPHALLGDKSSDVGRRAAAGRSVRSGERTVAGRRAHSGGEECGGREEHGKRMHGVGREVQTVEDAACGQRWRAAIEKEVEVRRHGEWRRGSSVDSTGLS